MQSKTAKNKRHKSRCAKTCARKNKRHKSRCAKTCARKRQEKWIS